MNGTTNKVLAIGIEVGNHALVRDWIREGQLPTLSRLSEAGALGPLSTVSDISSGSIWPSFSTGTNPLKNGQFFTHMQLQSGTYRICKKYADDVAVEPFWAHIARTGRRVFTFDVAQTRPIDGFNGINLCAWGSEYPAWPRSSWPKPLMRELVARHGSHPLVNEYRLSISPETESEYRTFYARLIGGMDRKGGICLDVMKREPWDLSLVVFPEVHWAMHLLWQTRDSTHPAHDPELELPFDDIFLDLYRRLDAWIGRFTNALPDASVLVFSGSGLGPNYSGWHLLPEFLEKIGMGPVANADARRNLAALLPMQKWGASKIRKLEDTLSVGLIERLKKTVPAAIWDRVTRRILFAGNRWCESKAFCVPNDYSGAIRVNLKGREPAGIVAPGDEYERTCDEIETGLRALVDGETGEPVVADVIRVARRYPGQPLGDFPDLIVTWTNTAPVNSIASPGIGSIARDFPERRSGAHRDDCFLISSTALRGYDTTRKPGIVDLAPTICDLLAVDAPPWFDGTTLCD